MILSEMLTSTCSVRVDFTDLCRVDICGLQMLIELLSELALRILPHLAIFAAEPVLLLREPVGLIRSSLRDQLDLKPGIAEDVEGMQGLGDE